jgi:hypothetical protein
MKQVDQIIIDPIKGDCFRAAIASMFELKLEQVPHFGLFPRHIWFDVFYYFCYALGYQYQGTGHPERKHKIGDYLINGCVHATVWSRTFDGKTHSVLIDGNGVVIHDPNPNKAFMGVNVVESLELSNFYLIEKRKEENNYTNVVNS